MKSTLDQLREMTTIVADTGDLSAVQQFRPLDCTTNPSIILQSIATADFKEILNESIAKGMSSGQDVETICAELTVLVGSQLVGLVSGRVSTEVEARLSFDVERSVARAREIISQYEDQGIGRDRVLIKLAATWEGIKAAEQLQKDGIDCNLTLVFCLSQARACGDVGAYLISPFVGRITDWYSKKTGNKYNVDEDPGVVSVRKIYSYFKKHGFDTIVMGASFRTTEQIEALAGCDRLTIAPKLLEQLDNSKKTIQRKLFVEEGQESRSPINQRDLLWELNENEMAYTNLGDGIRRFHADSMRLEEIIAARMN